MELDLGDGFFLRKALWGDHQALNRVCLLTGNSGQDASGREDDPDLLGLIYAVPYQVHCPDFAFVVQGPDGVCGYVLGAPDSAEFYEWAQAEWYPPLAARLPDPGPDRSQWQGSDWARRMLHHPDFRYPEALHAYPAHGHIDLLPQVQGRRIGARALQLVMDRLAAFDAPGMHLGVSPTNTGAIRFYEKMGFSRLKAPGIADDDVVMVTSFG